MLKVYTCDNAIIMKHYKNVLEDHDIHCMIKNESLQSTAGEVAPIVAWPELWVLDLEKIEQAKSLIDELTQKLETPQEKWHCSHCNEENEGQFNICWQCSQLK